MLPTLSSPKYTVKIPSTGKTVEYRPYLVKEERILMMAQESEEPAAVTRAIAEIINACTFGKIDSSKLCLFDVEYIFIKLRAKSVGETSKILVKCSECGELNPVEIALDTIEVDTSRSVSAIKTVRLTDEISVSLKYLTLTDLEKFGLSDAKDSIETLATIVAASIDTVSTSTEVLSSADFSKDELIKFVDSMNREQLQSIQKFIETTPTISTTAVFKCKSCGKENSIKIAGLQSFFS